MKLSKWLIIADDLTGGADTGVKFSANGLKTLLAAYGGGIPFDFAGYAAADALVINTDSRALEPAAASNIVSGLLKAYDGALFPRIYKKIDSTLRGNIGAEIDAVLSQTGIPMAFLTPALPKQGRIVSEGILMVGGRPLSATEFARDAVSPVSESRIAALIQRQSSNKVGYIGLRDVSSGNDGLRAAVERERRSGNRIIVFDAVREEDLACLAEVAWQMPEAPLLAGSGGLAGEVAGKISGAKSAPAPECPRKESIRRVFIISGSASAVTHEQLRRVERNAGVPSFEMDPSFFLAGGREQRERLEALSSAAARALAAGHCLIKVCEERMPEKLPDLAPSHSAIVKRLGRVAASVLQEGGISLRGLALVLTGGETATGILNALGIEGVEIEREILNGIVLSRPVAEKWKDMAVVTKAGGFGKEDALENILKTVCG